MTPENFAYWLQGYFELRQNIIDTPLTADQKSIIINHINLVKTTTPSNFFISTIQELLKEEGNVTHLIKRVLSGYFEHVIDLTHPDPVAADAAHSPPKVPQTSVPPRYPSEPPRMRC